MTNFMLTPRDLARSIGFEDFFKKFEELAPSVSYPPYNIRKVSDNKYVIEMAVAGFSKNDIEIDLEGDKLRIKGKITSQEDKSDYVWNGIAAREFLRSFVLADSVEVKNAEIMNGMLRVWLENVATLTKKKIEVSEGTGKQFLTE